ncbi:MAG: hypothetical protein IKN26_00810, partial [Eubacterium sp.]|nr:hypothetical protein [Eubacterium sp.]
MLIQTLYILIGAGIILLYIPPLVSLGVINAGNLFGFILGGGLILIGILHNKILDLIKHFAEIGKGKIVYSAIAVICALGVAFFSLFFVTLGSVISHSHYTANDEKTLIVLGCQIRGSVPSMSLVQRADAAVKYLEEH